MRKPIAIICGIVLFIAAVGYFALTRTIDHFVKEGALDRAIGKKTTVILRADTDYLPSREVSMANLHDRLVAAAEEQLAKGFLAPIFKPAKSFSKC